MIRILFSAFLIAAVAPGGFAASGASWKRHTIDAASKEDGQLGADGVRLGEANGDNLPDIVTGWENGDAIRVCLNPGPAGAGAPWTAVAAGRVTDAEDAVFADLDGDGNLDVVTSTEGKTKTVFFHWAPGPDKFLDSTAWKTEAVPVTENRQRWMFALPFDIDGRNGIDLVVGSKDDGAAVGWLESPANPRDVSAWQYHQFVDAGWIMSLRAADMDHDGDEDILYSDRKGAAPGVYWLENPGAKKSSETWTRHRVGGDGLEVMFLDDADINGDGLRDIVVACKGAGIRVYLRGHKTVAAPWSEHVVAMPEGTGTEKAARVADINLDGRQDIVVTCENATGDLIGAFWLEHTGPKFDSTWISHDISGPEGIKFDRIEMLDLDDDGDLDMLTCEERDQLGVFWFENPLH